MEKLNLETNLRQRLSAGEQSWRRKFPVVGKGGLFGGRKPLSRACQQRLYSWLKLKYATL